MLNLDRRVAAIKVGRARVAVQSDLNKLRAFLRLAGWHKSSLGPVRVAGVIYTS